MVEEQRGGQLGAGGETEPVAQLDGHEGVEAQLAERPLRVDGVRGVMPEDTGDLGADQGGKDAFLVRLVPSGQLFAQCLETALPSAVRGLALRDRPPCFRQVGEERAVLVSR